MNREKINVVFERIYRENLHDMYKVALYYTLHEQAAVEITQKAFYNLYLHIEEVNLETVRAYLGRTIRNMTYNWTRDNKIAKEGNIEDYYEELMIESLEEIIIRKEEKEIAWRLASNISPVLISICFTGLLFGDTARRDCQRRRCGQGCYLKQAIPCEAMDTSEFPRPV